MTRAPNLREEKSLSIEEEWIPLPSDTAALGVRTAVLKSTVEISHLQDVIQVCAAQDFELLFWTPNAEVGAELHGKEWFTGYVTAKAVEFQLQLASSHILADPKGNGQR